MSKKKYFSRLLKWILNNKKQAGLSLVVLLLFSFLGYKYLFNKEGETRYVLAAVEKQTIVSTVSGSGQVSASHQIDLKAKTSGQITAVYVKTGDKVKAGQLIAKIDSRDAEIALENARISYEKLTAPADTLDLLQAKNSLQTVKESKSRAENDLVKSYESGFSNVADAYLNLPEIITDLKSLFYSRGSILYEADIYYVSSEAKDLRQAALRSLSLAEDSYKASFEIYKTVNRSSATSSLENLIKETYKSTLLLSQAVKDAKNAVDEVYDEMPEDERANKIGDTKTDISNWTSKVNGHLTELLSSKDSIKNGKEEIISLSRQIREKEESLLDLENGADALDVRAQGLSLQQKQNDYEDYFIRAPFDGTIAQLNVKVYDEASGSIGILITEKKIAEVSLNEVDIVKVAVGQNVTLTFDAVEDLTIVGTVSEVDQVASVSQGVVSYNVKIAFDTIDNQIKPGMSVSAIIATDVAEDVLAISSSAIKEQGGIYTVEVADSEANLDSQGVILTSLPIVQTVEIGLTDDTSTEIKSGLKEGDKVVIRTIASNSGSNSSDSKSNNKSATSLLGGGGPAGGGFSGGR